MDELNEDKRHLAAVLKSLIIVISLAIALQSWSVPNKDNVQAEPKTGYELSYIDELEKPKHEKLEKIKIVENKSKSDTNVAIKLDGSKEDWMRQAGISDIYHANKIVHKESTWNVGVVNSIGCIGLIQACPNGLKPRMVAECPNWAKNPVCQLRIAESYMQARYGTWSKAWAFHTSNNWW